MLKPHIHFMQHQLEGINWLQNRPAALLADDMGLGKTLQTLAVCEDIHGPKLIICPNMARYVCEEEIAKWTDTACLTLEGTSQHRTRQLNTLYDTLRTHPDTALYVLLNYESMRRITTELLQIPWQVIVFDEAHHLKNRKTKSFKCAKQFWTRSYRPKDAPVPKLIQLTGTPITNQPDDLWSLLHLCDRDQFASYWRFVKQFCIVWNNGFGNVVEGLRNEPLLHRTLAPFVLRRTKDEVLDLPPKTHQNIWLDMDATTRAIYDDMKTKMVMELPIDLYAAYDSGKPIQIFATQVLAQLTRLRQLAVSPTLFADGPTSKMHGPKIDALIELIDSAPGHEQWVVFSTFSTAIRQACNSLNDAGIAATYITGDTDEATRRQRLDAFRNRQSQVLLLTTGVGSTALTLTNARYVVFLNMDWSPAQNTQAEDRLYRTSQQRAVTVYRLLYQSSVDVGVLQTNAIKEHQSDMALTFQQILGETDPVPTTFTKPAQKITR